MYSITIQVEQSGNTYLVSITPDYDKFIKEWIAERNNIIKESVKVRISKYNHVIEYKKTDDTTIIMIAQEINENGFTTWIKLEGDVRYQF